MQLKEIEAAIMRAVPQDKCLHVIAGVIVFALANLLVPISDERMRPLIGCAVVAVVGALKEITDRFDGGDSSIYDWSATCVGGLLGLACELQVHGVL